MQNTMRFRYDKLRKTALNLLIFYLMSTVFERQAGLSFISSVGIYAFLGMGMVYICLKSGVVGLGNSQVTVRALLCFLAIPSLIWLPESIVSTASGFAWRFFTSVVIAFVISNIVYSKKDVKKILFGFCAAGAFLSVNFYITYGSEIMVLAEKMEAAERLGHEYGNLNEVAQRCMFAFIISFYYAFFDKTIEKKWKRLALINVILCFSVIMFTGSRRALIVSVIAISVMYFNSAKNGSAKDKLGVILKGVIAIVVITYLVMNVPIFANVRERLEGFFQTFSGKITEDSTGDLNRMKYVTEGLNYFKDNILFGGGICYSISMFGTYAHNNYIEMLINFGLVGFVIYYYGYFSNLIKIVKFKISRFGEVKNLFLVLMLTIMLVDIGVVSYYERYMCIILSLISAYFTNRVHMRDENGVLMENEHIYENLL